MATRNQIINAVGSRKVVTFRYKNEEERTAEFYYHGIHKESNEEEVRAYQISGFSESAENGWKLFKVSAIKLLKQTEEEISYRKDYEKDDKDFKRLISRVIERKVGKV